jgi:hypothetical protein
MRRLALFALAASIFSLSPSSQAAPLRSWKTQVAPERRESSEDWRFHDQTGSPWRLIAGFDGGYASYGSLKASDEGTKTGYSLGGRVRLAYYWFSLVAEAGGGGSFTSVKGKNPAGSILCAAGCTDSIVTKIPFVDASIRYRFGRYLQFGPAFQMNLGSDFALNTDVNSGIENHGMYVGAEAVHEWVRERKFRVGARWLTPVSGTTRSVHQIQAFFQMAFELPFSGSSTRPRRVLEQVTEEDLDRASYSTPRSSLPMAIPGSEPPANPDEVLEPVPVPTPSGE